MTARRRRIMFICLLVIILMPVLYYSLYFLLRGPLPPNPQLIAHRGGRDHNPENTLLAFQHAIDLGANWLEFDVQMSSDGALVVIHDETVERTTNGTGNVADLTLAQLCQLDAGNGQKIPTLAEVLDLAKAAHLNILPELKSPQLYPGIEAKIIEALVAADYLANTRVQSFNFDTLDTVHQLNPAVNTCPLYGIGDFNLSGPQPGQATVVCPMAEMVLLYPWMLRQIHADGYQAYVWFGIIEHPLTQRLLLTLGADGLMVDNTESLSTILIGD